MDRLASYEEGLESGRLALGSLCRKGHEWKSTGRSIRRAGKNDCLECNRESHRIRQPAKTATYDDPRRALLPGKPYSQLDVERFWSHVIKPEDTDACWGWKGWTVEEYGMVHVQGKDVRGPRFSWELHNGRPIPEGLEIMHDCDNPPCANPRHIKAVTHAENIADRDRKGRTARGDKAGAHLHPERLPRGDNHWRRRLKRTLLEHRPAIASSFEEPAE